MKNSHIIQGVPFISQLGVYPTGCESVSLAMVLQYYGVDISVDEIIQTCLPKGEAPHELPDGTLSGCDPLTHFPGDPYSPDGWGCFAPAVRCAAQRALEEKRPLSRLIVEEVCGESLETLCSRYVQEDIPVILFATIHMQEPTPAETWRTPQGRLVRWISPMHCLVLIGFDETGFFFQDPTDGENAWFPKEAVLHAYEAQGKQAVVIRRE